MTPAPERRWGALVPATPRRQRSFDVRDNLFERLERRMLLSVPSAAEFFAVGFEVDSETSLVSYHADGAFDAEGAITGTLERYGDGDPTVADLDWGIMSFLPEGRIKRVSTTGFVYQVSTGAQFLADAGESVGWYYNVRGSTEDSGFIVERSVGASIEDFDGDWSVSLIIQNATGDDPDSASGTLSIAGGVVSSDIERIDGTPLDISGTLSDVEADGSALIGSDVRVFLSRDGDGLLVQFNTSEEDTGLVVGSGIREPDEPTLTEQDVVGIYRLMVYVPNELKD
jgi:hypothetical protein